jgi:hypothetical protein
VGNYKKKPRGPYYIYTVRDVADLFGVHYKTVQYWMSNHRIDISDLEDIVDKYVHRWKVDKKLKKPESV